MALSPNYGWAEPDNSSLVKNGAQDIRALGDAIDTSVWNIGFGQAGKNKIINGDFGIWQRGTSFTGNQYTADRFASEKDGTATVTVTRQSFTPATAPAAPYESSFFLQSAVSVVGTGTYHRIFQRIEDVRTFAGQPVTMSFWARLDSGATGSAYFRMNQNFGSGGSSQVLGTANTFTMTSSWQRFSATVTPASISGKTIGTGSFVQFDILIPYTATNTVQIWGVQAEYGSKATPFQTATGTIQGELAACQRYYYRSTANGVYSVFANGHASSTTTAYMTFYPKVSMRSSPTSVDYSTLLLGDGVSSTAVNSLTFSADNVNSNAALLTVGVASGLTQYRPYYLIANNSSSAYVGLSAEL